jgi:hypothetical protein
LPSDAATNRDRLLEAYFAHVKAMQQGIQDDPDFWAVEEIWKLIERDPEGTWTLVLEMLQARMETT